MELTPDELARRVAAGHSFDNHVIRDGQFKNAALGPVIPIETREDLQKHVADVVKSKETLCIPAHPDRATWRHAEVFYHEPSNTMVVVPLNPAHEATAYRPKNGKLWFDKKVHEVQLLEDKFLVVCHGIDELRRVIEEDRAIAQEEERLLKIIEERERKAREEGKGRSK